MDIPETRYAKTTDGVQVAYQVAGEADIDLIKAPGTQAAPPAKVFPEMRAVWERQPPPDASSQCVLVGPASQLGRAGFPRSSKRQVYFQRSVRMQRIGS